MGGGRRAVGGGRRLALTLTRRLHGGWPASVGQFGALATSLTDTQPPFTSLQPTVRRAVLRNTLHPTRDAAVAGAICELRPATSAGECSNGSVQRLAVQQSSTQSRNWTPGADPGGGRWGACPPLGRRFTIQNALFNSIQAPVNHWAPTPGRNPVSAPEHKTRDENTCLEMKHAYPVSVEVST